MLPGHWIEYRREDGERVGWIAPSGEDFLAFDALGRQATPDPVDWLAAEEVLEELGLRFIGDRFLLEVENIDGVEGDINGKERPVRISEVSTDAITVVTDAFGGASAVGSGAETIRLPFPAPDTLRPAG